mmetsp:Transcript_4294/g.9316  ORF Transcript_4294/g.9316 Transcript_4294/m.9316 type:complete len:473 (+) Transcript_4294:148-1566(+)|eukprot:CAMPEP_0202892104 /NCGR_PEP_ID=MMETSP1392-20130828/1931_1 /ASSEMBLY_ACC=CAM_ASM_000868 /TAXON_ID=225041 /ORGANISM="Chlamydomonas chlamydogama, Strain SAG 11-48b" /LENGTH=472 /DNA_ID=CAMNT_0049575985 /DNA_START=123 /DNA_END=1541 /DNA_ORIENTATION=+
MAASAAPNGAGSKEWNGGVVLFAGGTNWAQLGRAGGKKGAQEDENDQYPNLPEPYKLKNLEGIRIAFVAAGSTAVHCLAGDTEGRLYTWGRNEKGQLGHGDLVQRNMPKVVEGLKGKFITAAAGGKHHSMVVTKDGESFGFGCNQMGQLGIGSVKKGASAKAEDLRLDPVKALVTAVSAVACGAEFTLWIAGGSCWAAGSPQYGQTGDGSDHQHNTKDSSIAMAYEPQPTPKLVAGALAGKSVTRIACGQNHSVAVDTEGAAYTWGFGGYGRLGHRVQKDEFAPKKVEEFKGRISVPADAVVAASSTASFCTTAPTGQLYTWGKLKVSGDNQMYPQAMMDMSGWNVRSVACGPTHYVIAADNSTITWGHATNGELAYGPNGKKSSANPDKCNALEGLYVHQVAAGVGFSLFLAEPDEAKLDKYPSFESSAPETEVKGGAEEEDGGKGKGKGKAAAGAKRKAEPAAGKGKKAK